MPDATTENWKAAARAEIASVKIHYAEKHGWEISVSEGDDLIHLYVVFRHATHAEAKSVLRLTYTPGFPTERPREEFVNPENFAEEGVRFWIDDGQQAFKSNHQPPVICLEGTWGFHQNLHRDRPVERVVLTKLLLEVQLCFNRAQ